MYKQCKGTCSGNSKCCKSDCRIIRADSQRSTGAIESVTQESAAGAEQTAHAAADLLNLTENLQKSMGIFKLNHKVSRPNQISKSFIGKNFIAN
jgi:hypothetical protein